ncbi:hypothetical protein F751_0411 [Auxenochlorella protothecoides]|uniref:RWP-RK domain-containing protein n=1 Tax=Auxenochlorella protothecoides TaxID=3075 RepID=A0A087SBC3_AUXPR|nr:hypothetical protein F751_0411 [Auxenochlorella protothecoides]KFM23027.1 hypothetical protein F751_0411 [Auxenochlorella protothecoides]
MIMGEGDTGFGALKRSRKRTRAGRFSSEITLKELEACYHLPAQVACGRLGVGLTILKRICRAHGVAAWPYRKQYKYELGDTPHPIADTPTRPPIPAFRGWTPPAALAAKPQDAARGAPPGEAADGLRRRALASLLSLVLQRGTPGEGAASAAVAAELARCLQHQACRAPAEVRDKAPLCGEAWQPRDVARPPAEDAWQPPAVGAWQQQLDAWQQPQHLDASQQRNLDAWQQVDCWSTGRVMPPATAPAPQHDWRRGVPASTLAAARHDSRQYTHVRHLLASVGRA